MLLSSRHTLLLPYQFVSSQLAQNEPGTPPWRSLKPALVDNGLFADG
jgi:hypothetical protein